MEIYTAKKFGFPPIRVIAIGVFFIMLGAIVQLQGQCLPSGTFSMNHSELNSGIKDFTNPFASITQNICTMSAQKVRLYIKLDLGDDYELGKAPWSVDLMLQIQVVDPSNIQLHAATQNFSLNETSPEQLWVMEFPNICFFYLSEKTIFSANSYSATSNAANKVRLTAWYEYETKFDVYGVGVQVQPVNGGANPVNANPVPFNWQPTCECMPNFQFQLLRLYNTDPAQTTETDIITTLDWSKALTIETQSNDPSLALTVVEGTGFYAWRVRPIGTDYPGGIANSANWGSWSNQGLWNTIGSNPLSLVESAGAISTNSVISGFSADPFFYYVQFDDTLNWIYSRTFSEAERSPNGKVKISEQITYANGLLQVVQNQKHLFSKQQVLVNQTAIDYAGRPALSTLYAPKNGNALGFSDNFAKNGGSAFSAANFDTDNNFRSPEEINAGELSDYYSNTNPDPTIPSAEGYAYARTLYYGDGLNRPRESSNVGKDLRITSSTNPSHTTKYFYSGVSDAELIRMFGDEAPAAASVVKMVVVDPNQTVTVSYQDKVGNTLATCLSANDNSAHHDPLPTRGGFTVLDTIDNNIPCGDHCLSSSTTATFNTNTSVDLHYEIDPNTWEEMCTNSCQTCDYTILISIRRLDDACDPLFPQTWTIPILPTACSSGPPPPWDLSGFSLAPGTYQFERKLITYNTDPATVISNPPLGDKYIEQQLKDLKTTLENGIDSDPLWITIKQYLDNNQSNDLYQYLVDNQGLTPGATSFTFTAGCCEFTLPIKPCESCPIIGNDFEGYFSSVYPYNNTTPSLTPYADDPGTATLEYMPEFSNGQLNLMILNMIADGYDSQKLCDCWVNAVQAWSALKQLELDGGFEDEGISLGSATTIPYIADLAEVFLDCAGRKFYNPPVFGGTFDPTHAYSWFDYTPGPNVCEAALCDGATNPGSPYYQANITCSGGQVDWSSATMTDQQWQMFYDCTVALAEGASIPELTLAEVLAFGASLENSCLTACDNRLPSFLTALEYEYQQEIGYPIVPNCSTDPSDIDLYHPNCVTYDKIYCQAYQLLELCKEGCDALVPILDSNGDVVGYDLNSLVSLQQSMYYPFDLTMHDPCPRPYVPTQQLSTDYTSISFAGWVVDFLNTQLDDLFSNTIDEQPLNFNVIAALNMFQPGLGDACFSPAVSDVISATELGNFVLEGCNIYYIDRTLRLEILICTDVCQYYSLSCPQVCFRWRAPEPVVPDHVFTPITCEQQTSDFGLSILYSQYSNCIDQKLAVYEQQYRDSCINPNNVRDLFTVRYELGYYHYTLYYFDCYGSLVQTVPPQGVDLSSTNRFQHPDHKFRTKYWYNTLRQLIWQYTPDGGETEFIYDKKGQLRFSQNAQQRVDGSFAYTKYDYLGRAIESGKAALGGSLSWNDLQQNIYLEDASFPNSSLSERVFTVYSTPYPGILAGGQPQRYLQNRVSYTFTDDDGDLSTVTDRRATYYSYDVHGNVERVVQDVMPELQQSSPVLRQFVMEYDYDLVSNQVLQLKFMPGRADQFFTAYSYDEDNRITEVRTSRDGYLWDRDARYAYYAHGPLSRSMIGDDDIQGLDNVFTIQGWLKSINHPTLDAAKDPGLDGFGSSKVANDVFASGLGYFQGDFKHTGSQFDGEQNFTNNFGFIRNLYNGNISTWVSNSATNTTLAPGYKHPGLTGRHFKYDELNRLIDSDFSYFNSNWKTTPEYDSRYTYDGNGNLKTLDRFAHYKPAFLWFQAKHMDCLTYDYESGTNQLATVNDGFWFPNLYSDDLDGLHRYEYDETGNLTDEYLNNDLTPTMTIEWNLMGKVRRVTKNDDDTVIDFAYDATGNRILKKVTPAGGPSNYTWYAYDASGNMISTYTRNNGGMGAYTIQQKEAMLYGSQRIGVWNTAQDAFGLSNFGGGYNEFFKNPATELYTRHITQKAYELNDHLGNVRMTVSDVKLPVGAGFTADVLSGSEYYPFGMLMVGRNFDAGSSRFGFNGKENDNEVKGRGNSIDYGARLFDTRIGRWSAVEPFARWFPMHSSYAYAANNPVLYVDYDGRYFGIDDGVAALIGGGINLGVALYKGDVRNFGQGLAYFGAGATAGTLALYPEFGGWAIGGAIVSGTDAAITEYNSTEKVTFNNVISNSATGAVVGQVGGWAISKVAPIVTKYTSAVYSKVVNTFVNKQGRTVQAIIEIGELEVAPFADDLAANAGAAFTEGSFSVFNWSGYPAGGIKPSGPFRLLEGIEYSTARKLANKTNAALHKANPQLKGLHIHEIHPVKFGGSPTDMSNKIFLTPTEHAKYTNFWNSLMRSNK